MSWKILHGVSLREIGKMRGKERLKQSCMTESLLMGKGKPQQRSERG